MLWSFVIFMSLILWALNLPNARLSVLVTFLIFESMLVNYSFQFTIMLTNANIFCFFFRSKYYKVTLEQQ